MVVVISDQIEYKERERETQNRAKRLALWRTIAADEFAAVVQLIRERGLCGGEEPSGSATVDVTDWDRHRESSNRGQSRQIMRMEYGVGLWKQKLVSFTENMELVVIDGSHILYSP